jgi:hypothetical protein
VLETAPLGQSALLRIVEGVRGVVTVRFRWRALRLSECLSGQDRVGCGPPTTSVCSPRSTTRARARRSATFRSR